VNLFRLIYAVLELKRVLFSHVFLPHLLLLYAGDFVAKSVCVCSHFYSVPLYVVVALGIERG
jgi:hypothetical protein